MRLFRPGFRARVTLRWTLGFSVLLAILLVLTYSTIRRTTYRDLDRELRTLAATEAASAMDGPVNPHVHEPPLIVLAGGAFTQKMSVIFDRQHRVVASSPESIPEPFVSAQAISAALAGEAPLLSAVVGGTPVRAIVVRMEDAGQPYALAVALDVGGHLETLAGIRGLLALVWGLGTLATAGLGFLLASHVLRPVQQLTARAMAIAETDLQARLEAPGTRDEVADMTASLNGLLARLQSALEANRRFAADAAHELRSPVTAVTGEIDVALRRERSAAEYRDTLVVVRTRLHALATLIEGLLVLVRAQEGRETVLREPLALAELVDGSVQRFAAAAAARQVTVCTVGLGDLRVYGESGLLARVFDNLIDNAIRYNRPGGHVTIRGRVEPAAPGLWQADAVVVAIEDTGHGIGIADRERVFERFFRVDSSRTRGTGGSGLGLAIVREVMTLLQGTIEVESSSEAGTTLVLRMAGERSPA